jgi:hypothetical protein
MRERQRATIEELRQAIECLPRKTRVAMLEGIQRNDIIAGAYSTRDGICPMLAAHRAGGRTDCIAFARAWDRFAFRSVRGGKARRASERELLVLRTHLETSLLADDGPSPELAAAMAEHRALVAERERRDVQTTRRAVEDRRRRTARTTLRPGDPDRSQELRGTPGWSWTRVFRRLDDYERALARVRAQRPEREAATVAGSEAATLAHSDQARRTVAAH